MAAAEGRDREGSCGCEGGRGEAEMSRTRGSDRGGHEQRTGDGDRRDQIAMGDERRDQQRGERRRGERGDDAVRGSEAGGAADHRQHGGDRDGDRARAQPGARRVGRAQAVVHDDRSVASTCRSPCRNAGANGKR